ncbi:MAG: heavy metal translocating P-type ATPase, partial [Myxococcota bacterium]
MPSPQMDTSRLHFRIRGMECAEEVTALRRELGPLVGNDERLAFDLLSGKLVVEVGPEGPTQAQILAGVERTGLRAEPWVDEATAGEEGWSRHSRTLVASASGLSLLVGFLSHASGAEGLEGVFGIEGPGEAHHVPFLARAFYGLAIVAGFWLVLPRAWASARRLRPDMNVLMTVAVLGALTIGEWFEGGAVAFLFAVSLALEAWSVGRARRAVAALMDLSPATAHVIGAAGATADVAPHEVALGAQVGVRPGERIPLDGHVLEGESAVDQAPITGESMPVEKAPGAPVYAGTINGNGALVVEVTKVAGDSTLARIIRMVGEAHARRAPSEQWVDRFARVYTPAVMALALGVVAAPPLLLGLPFDEWLYRGLVLLVIACPCALVISTPVSIVAGLTSAAREGVLIKGGQFLEAPAHLKAIAFDKTGTLTLGRPRVADLVPLDGHSDAELLRSAAAMEARSDHPLARAILEAARERGLNFKAASDFQILQGKGATATLEGRPYWLGSHRFLEERNQETPDVHARLDAMSADGHSVVVIGNERHACGLIALADELRPEAAESLERLQRLGVLHLVMLTGDNAETARKISEKLGLREVEAELLPEDKVAAIEALVTRYEHVAMIGDGVNDAPAMARASVAIAMGAVGSDAAIETADIALMGDDL